jgi:ribosome-associated translation inhibitor RaiA
MMWHIPWRARWQEEVLAKADLLEHEGQLLCRRYQTRRQNHQDEKAIRDSVMTAVSAHLQAARNAANVPNNPWPNGSTCEGAFVNLHAAQVLLVNLYSEDDIQASIPAVLNRLQKCLPKTDRRRIDAERRFGPTPDNANDSAARQPERNIRNDTRRGVLAVRNHRANHADPAGTLAQQRAALRHAMQVGYDAQDKLYTQVRSFRNILIVGTLVLIFGSSAASVGRSGSAG